MVLNNDFHDPSILARAIATLDLLSDGRVEMGLGAGHSKPEYDHAGMRFDPAPVRVSRLDESVVVLRQLLDGATVTTEGEHYQLTEQRCEPLPRQAHVPILVGGGGRRVHQIAARHADAVGFTGLVRVHVDGQHAEPSRFAAGMVDEDADAVRVAAGQRIDDLELQVLVQAVNVTDDADGAADEIRSAHLPTLTRSEVLATPYLIIGSTGSLIEKLTEHRERWGFSHYTVRREALGQIEPVIASLAGS